jgi:hypothetical protein
MKREDLQRLLQIHCRHLKEVWGQIARFSKLYARWADEGNGGDLMPSHKTRVLRPEAFAGGNPSVGVVGIAIAVLKLYETIRMIADVCEDANISRSIPCQPA